MSEEVRRVVMPVRSVAVSLGLATGLLAASSLAAAQSNCRTETITVTGEKKRAIDDATRSAMEAAKAEIKKRYGNDWGLGPRRSAKFTCEKWLGGPAHRIGWTCKLATTACRRGAG